MENLKVLLKQKKHEQFLKQFPEDNNFMLCEFVKLKEYTNDKDILLVINEFIKKRFKMEEY